MKPKQTGLGKGLNAIFDIEDQNIPKQVTRRDSTVSELPLENITPNPNQPRTLFDEQTLEELAQSIRRLGVIQPITVRRTGEDRYMIISGERRYRASLNAGLETIPAYVREANDQTLLEMALVENIQREDLNAIEVALSLQRLIEECDLTQETLAERVGKKRSTITNYIRLLKLPAQIQSALSNDMITMGHARALLSLPDEKSRLGLLARILKNHLSVRQVEQIIQERQAQKATSAKKSKEEYPACYADLVEKLEPLVGRKISIQESPRKKGAGKIVIGYDSEDQIRRIVERLQIMDE